MLERLDFSATQFEYLEANGSKKLRMRKSKAVQTVKGTISNIIQYFEKKKNNTKLDCSMETLRTR